MTNNHSDMRRAMESAENHDARDARSERLLTAARRVWAGSRPDPEHPDRVIVSREAMDALGAVLADT